MRLHLHEWGPAGAPVLVCLHGVTGYGGRFGALANRLAGRFRVVAPDLRGHGLSRWEPPWNLEAHVADLLETFAGVTPHAWIGHSFGGRLILELPDELVQRQVLLDPVVQFPARYAYERAEEERAEKAFESPDEAIAARLRSGLHLRTPRPLIEREAEEHLERGHDGRLHWRYSQAAVVALFGELSRDPPAIETRSCPTLLVLGADVTFTHPQQAARFQNAQLVRVPGGHLVLMDALHDTTRAVEGFLA